MLRPLYILEMIRQWYYTYLLYSGEKEIDESFIFSLSIVIPTDWYGVCDAQNSLNFSFNKMSEEYL